MLCNYIQLVYVSSGEGYIIFSGLIYVLILMTQAEISEFSIQINKIIVEIKYQKNLCTNKNTYPNKKHAQKTI